MLAWLLINSMNCNCNCDELKFAPERVCPSTFKIGPAPMHRKCSYTVSSRKDHTPRGSGIPLLESFASCHSYGRNFDYLNWFCTRNCGDRRPHVGLCPAHLVFNKVVKLEACFRILDILDSWYAWNIARASINMSAYHLSWSVEVYVHGAAWKTYRNSAFHRKMSGVIHLQPHLQEVYRVARLQYRHQQERTGTAWNVCLLFADWM